MNRLPKSYRELAGIIGREGADALCRAYGGDKVYIPKAEGLTRMRRDEAIRSAYDGANKEALAARYGLSPRSVEIILKKRRKPCEQLRRKVIE